MNKNDAIFDTRVLEMNLRQGIITEADLAKFLKSLPDRASVAASVSIIDLAPAAYIRATLGLTRQQAIEVFAESKAETGKAQK